MKHFWRVLFFVLPFGFVAFCVLYLVHRVGEGDSYSRSAGGSASLDFGPVVSLATGRVVFASFQTGRGDLYMVDAQGSHMRQLTRNNDCESSPVFSPNGKQIAFIKETPQAWSINGYKGQAWVMDADGTHAHAVTHDETNYIEPTFSADGKFLYLVRLTPSAKVNLAQLFRVNVDGNHDPVPVPGGTDRQPAPIPEGDQRAANLSPDKKREVSVYWSHDYQALRLVPAKSKGAATHTVLKLKTDLSNPCFSKDGHWLFFHEGNRFGPIALSKVAINGTGYKRVAQTSR